MMSNRVETVGQILRNAEKNLALALKAGVLDWKDQHEVKDMCAHIDRLAKRCEPGGHYLKAQAVWEGEKARASKRRKR